uniref:Uncharacterized protein n=1 Tax=Opuntia streptacantha TaxID=393608 RepID=A0A7C9D3X7_OPUST
MAHSLPRRPLRLRPARRRLRLLPLLHKRHRLGPPYHRDEFRVRLGFFAKPAVLARIRLPFVSLLSPSPPQTLLLPLLHSAHRFVPPSQRNDACWARVGARGASFHREPVTLRITQWHNRLFHLSSEADSDREQRLWRYS